MTKDLFLFLSIPCAHVWKTNVCHFGSCLIIINVSWWRHQMEKFSALMAICVGNTPGTVKFPAQMASNAASDASEDQWRGALMFPFICVWINGWVNNREVGDLRRYRGHYDVTVMFTNNYWLNSSRANHKCICLSKLVCIMVCRLFGVKPLYKPRLTYCQIDHRKYISIKFYFNFNKFHSAILSRPHF